VIFLSKPRHLHCRTYKGHDSTRWVWLPNAEKRNEEKKTTDEKMIQYFYI